MKRHSSHFLLFRLICVFALICGLLSCGLTAFAAEATPESAEQAEPPPIADKACDNASGGVTYELYPTDVQTVTDGGNRQIVKTYSLSPEESPDLIPRDSFERDGWQYTFADVTEKREGRTDVREHIEIMELETESNDLDEVIKLLAPTLAYDDDGYTGLLSLDLASVSCEASDFASSTYTVTATREYANLPANDLYYIPKTVTENGRTLELDDVEWKAQSTVKAGYSDIPDSYSAVARYKGKATGSVATGYLTTANYTGEITKEIAGDAVYTVVFDGVEMSPEPEVSQEPEPAPKSQPAPVMLIIIIAVVVLLGGGAAFFFLRYNVRIYSIGEGGYRALAAKDKISAKNLQIDLTPLDGRSESGCFGLDIDRFAAKRLNGMVVKVTSGSASLEHKIAYEGDAYHIEVNLKEMTVKAIY